MKILFCVFIILKIDHIHNSESGCGCGLDRTNNDIKNNIENSFYSLYSNLNTLKNEKQCLVGREFTEQETSMVLIPTGKYQVGTDNIMIESDMEGPRRIINLNSFYIDKYEISNGYFREYVKATNYKTEAEIFGDSFVFGMFLNNTFKEKMKDYRAAQAPWWYKINGADWRHPYGPESDISDLMEHPVTHISWNDAAAFCAWRRARLPTEAEWEAACRGGHKDTKYPWGDKLFPNRQYMANIWQGTFPSHNSAKDGFIGTNPVQNFPTNDFGLHNMAGNVWEWVEDSWSLNDKKEKVKKGGSYLCHQSYCYRYRCSARSHNTEDSTSGNIGFRCARSA